MVFQLAFLLALGARPAAASVQAQADIPGLSATQEWKWLSNPAKFPEYYAVVTLTLPADADVSRAEATNGGRMAARTAGSLRVIVPGLSETIQGVTVGGQPRPIRLTIQVDGGKAIAEWNCKNLDLDLVPQGTPPANSYVGIACVKNAQNDVQIYISVPKETDWGSTSMFEDAGKGERWHQFTLQKYERATSEKEVGTFAFALGGKEFGYRLIQRKNAKLIAQQNASAVQAQQLAQEKKQLEKENKNLQDKVKYLATKQAKPEDPLFTFKGGLGIGKIAMTVATGSPSSMQPILIFGTTTKPLFLGMHVGTQVKYAIPIGTSSQAFYDIFGNIGPSFKIGDASAFSPVFGLVTMGQDYDPEGVSFRHTNTGLGLNFKFSSIWIEGLFSGMLPAGESKYMSLGLGYQPSSKDRVSLSYGAYYQKTSYTVVTSSYDQILAGVFLHF